MKMKAAIRIVTFLFFVLTPFFAHAESAKTLVTLGNELYAAGEYEKALEAYEKAKAEQPDSGEILFNEGNVYFRKGEFEKARESYQSAALKTKDLSLEAYAHYNQGNAIFAEGQKQLEVDPRKALLQWEQSIRRYQEAIRVDPHFTEAAQNIEVVRISIKDLADRIKKAEEASREKQKQLDEVRKQLDEVIKEQESELKENESLQEQKSRNPGESTASEVRKLAANQDLTRQKTEEISDKLKDLQPHPQQNQGSSQQTEPAASSPPEHLEKALEAQKSAVEKLEKQELDEARKEQQEALTQLQEAVASQEESKQNQCPNPQTGSQDGKEEPSDKDQENVNPTDQLAEEKKEAARPSEPQQSAEQKSEAEKKESVEKGSEQKAGALFSESPENILREEKENRLQLHRAFQGAHKPVDKDW
jgi:tetratricopeptide (TPR) repeat protein